VAVELWVGGNEAHVFVLGVILEGGVERIAPRRLDEVQQPRRDVPRGGDQPGEHPEAQACQPVVAPCQEVLHHEHVPLLVVVGGASLRDADLDAAGEARLAAGARNAALGDTFPRPVRHFGEVLEHEELLH
jgi:hypothetical protein